MLSQEAQEEDDLAATLRTGKKKISFLQEEFDDLGSIPEEPEYDMTDTMTLNLQAAPEYDALTASLRGDEEAYTAFTGFDDDGGIAALREMRF